MDPRAIALRISEDKRGMTPHVNRQPATPSRRIVALVVAASLMVPGYFGVYATCWWAAGYGLVSYDDATIVENTVFAPLLIYRFSPLPGGKAIDDLRNTSF